MQNKVHRPSFLIFKSKELKDTRLGDGSDEGQILSQLRKFKLEKDFLSMKRFLCTHLMRSGLCEIMLEEISFLSEHLSLFRRCSHVEISEPVKLLLIKKIHENQKLCVAIFGMNDLLSVSILKWGYLDVGLPR